MFQNILIFILIIITLTFINLSHPLAMGLLILCQTIIISCLTGLMNETFWFSYILFLVFLGGMLILFIYVSSLASNEMFSLSLNYFSIFMPLMLFIYFMTSDNMISNFFKSTPPINSISNLTMLFNSPSNYISMMLMIYLLITLIAIVKITNISYGPLRHMD